MPSRQEVKEKLRDFAHNPANNGWEMAEIGIIDSTGKKVVEADARPGYVNVRVFRAGTGMTETVVLNTEVSNTYGIKVWIGPNRDGELAVQQIREKENVEEHGAMAGTLAIPAMSYTGLVKTRQLEPGLVVVRAIDGAYTMQVYVYPFFYWHGAVLGWWPGGWIDLTANIPATAGQRHLTLIGHDPENNTLATVDGEDYGLAVKLTATQLVDIPPGDLTPLAAANLFNGMTAVNKDSLLIDARPWFSPAVAESGSGGSGTTTVWDPDLAPASPHASDDEFADESLDVQWTEHDPNTLLTVAETAGGVLRLTAADHTADYLNAVWMDPPDTTYTIVIKCTLVTTAVWSLPAWDGAIRRVMFGLVVSEDGTAAGKAFTAGVKLTQVMRALGPVNFHQAVVQNWLDANTPYTKNGNLYPISYPMPAGAYTWYLRVRRSPTDERNGTVLDYLWRFDLSTDGLTWTTVLASQDTAFNAASHVGVYLSNLHSGQAVSVDYEFFRYRAVFDAVTEPCFGQSTASSTGHTHVEADVTDLTHTDATAVHDNVAGEVAALTEKTVLVAADLLLLEDSAAGNAKKKAQVGRLPLVVDVTDISTPPTDAELDTAFGTPVTVGAGFTRLVNDGGAGNALYLVASDGTNWWHWAGTKAI